MNSFFPILNWAGLLLLKEKLSHCTPYQEAERDSRAQWAAFKASHPEALNEEVLDLLDRCNLAAAFLGATPPFVWASSWACMAALATSGYGAVVMTLQYGATAQAPPEA